MQDLTWLCKRLRTAEPAKLLADAFCMTEDNACIDAIIGCTYSRIIKIPK